MPEFAYDIDNNEFLEQPTFRQVHEDFIDFNFDLVDNGDDKVCLEFQLEKDKQINILSNMYIPITEPSRVMLAGAGHSVYLRETSLKQINRIKDLRGGIQKASKCQYECCCQVF